VARPGGEGVNRALGSRIGVLSLLVTATAWEAASRAWDYPFMPSLGRIARSAWQLTMAGEIPAALAASVLVLAVGYLLGASSGVVVGVLMGRFESVAIACEPYVNALLAVPSLLLVPILFGLFGLGRATAIAVAAIYVCPVVAVMTRHAVEQVDPALVGMVRVFGASERQVIRHVLLPGAMPTVAAGLRLGMGRAVRGVINAEMLLGASGLGALLRRYGTRFDAPAVFGILAILVAASLVVNGLMRLAEARVSRWQAGS
jgi:ABC-type nitrate/sulfonate/bicarbonate transport system permease component